MTDRNRVLVTGASKGIGRAVMRRLAEDGYRPVGLARSRPDDLAPNEEFRTCDLTDFAAIRDVIAGLVADEPFHGLVNNAGIVPTSSLDDLTVDEMRNAMILNFETALICTQAVLAGMKAGRSGRIVSISSRAALGKAGRTAYSAAKAAIIGATRTWALELAPFGITVNAVAPGPIATEIFVANNPLDAPRTRAFIDTVPVGRIGEPEDIAHAVAYLMDRRAGFITGQTLHVDGGLTVSVVKS